MVDGDGIDGRGTGGAFFEDGSGGCTAPNRLEVTLADFDPDSHRVVADLGALLAEVDIARNTQNTAPGCMSEAQDPECSSIFRRLGLPFGGQPAAVQQFFRLDAR